MPYINLPLYHDVGFSTTQIRKVEELLEKNPSIHWISLNSQSGIFELVLDNSIMSSFRTCPSLFIETWVEGRALKGGRSWILEFGTLFHEMMEIYYQNFRSLSFDVDYWAVVVASEKWKERNMDAFALLHKEYNTVGGMKGFCTLLRSYANRFKPENEYLRVIATEIAFGRYKEVPLGVISSQSAPWLDVYLAGRIDVLVDDGAAICPLDHKTKGTLRNDPQKSYEIDEGPCGYVFATNVILKQLVKELGLEDSLMDRKCNKIIMNYISKTPVENPIERFKRMSILKTKEQLQNYQQRMLLTAEDIFRALVRYAATGAASRSTDRCTGMYGSDCAFLPVHRQSSKENEIQMLNSFYTKGAIWNTEDVGKQKEKGDLNV